MGTKKTHPLNQTHEYPDTTVKPENGVPEDESEDIPEEDLYNLYRDIWQNPIGVIQQMGNLEGKVIADIGAGPYGYFSMQLASRTEASKIISIDIDRKAIDFIEDAKKLLSKEVADKIETRLVTPDDPKLEKGETDIILIVNTAIFFENRIAYFKNLRNGLSEDGKLIIIDFKMRNTPVGPPIENRIPLGRMEQDLLAAGYKSIESDDRTLNYQYIVIAGK